MYSWSAYHVTGKQLKMFSQGTVPRNRIELAETEKLPNSQKCLITLYIVPWVIIQNSSQNVSWNSSLKADPTGKDGKVAKQSKMLNNSAYSKLVNKLECLTALIPENAHCFPCCLLLMLFYQKSSIRLLRRTKRLSSPDPLPEIKDIKGT